ncbi:Xaa-Pro dipeptidase [Hondaea fermentalgiana]|uniref:Xaa-Pro dipeptidase n=1 Tax=Hondaea fermentalgiana TaxID=2315210 RepID=A0A2R5GPE9_9STRA|nr:Xaa-Pro dipeptidase [Hondaea fermentalgiana]|eukprot:GBG32756.1 Xaa-Pro dipeptidase [Hondaea fermentalgiana]
MSNGSEFRGAPPPVAGNGANGKWADALDLYEVDLDMYKENREKLVSKLKARDDVICKDNSIALFQGGPAPTRYDSDHEPIFRQESNFSYLFGVKEPDVYGVIELESGRTTLFFPKLPESYAIVMGEIRSAESFKKEYAVDDVRFEPELRSFIEDLDPKVIYTTRGLNKDSGIYAKEAHYEGVENHRVDNGTLYDVIVECRVIKSAREIALMRHINKISSQAHCWIMTQAQPGMREFQLESLFEHWGYFRGGCRHRSYTSICGCGGNGSILHYGHAGAPNDGIIEPDDMCLLDMGAEYKCYTSDITCTFPVSGKFSDDQRAIYEAVLDAQWTVMRAMKPGVSYVDMHTLAYRVILTHLSKLGVVKGDIDEMLAADLGAVFMPHGLGHFMGLDTHDVGGRAKGLPVQTRPGYTSLRCCATLEPGMVLTVEPGVYFNDYSLDKALADDKQAHFIDADALKRFRNTGGIRLEDDVLVTETGVENMTQCPRAVDDVEAVLAGKLDYTSTFKSFSRQRGVGPPRGSPRANGVQPTLTVVIPARPEDFDRFQRKRELGLTARPPGLEPVVQSPRENDSVMEAQQLPPQHRAGSNARRMPGASLSNWSQTSSDAASERSTEQTLANFRQVRDSEQSDPHEREALVRSNHVTLCKLEEEQHLLYLELEDQEELLEKLEQELQEDLDVIETCLDKQLIPMFERVESMHNDIVSRADELVFLQKEVELIVPGVVAERIEKLMDRVNSAGESTASEVELALRNVQEKKEKALAMRYLPRWVSSRFFSQGERDVLDDNEEDSPKSDADGPDEHIKRKHDKNADGNRTWSARDRDWNRRQSQEKEGELGDKEDESIIKNATIANTGDAKASALPDSSADDEDNSEFSKPPSDTIARSGPLKTIQLLLAQESDPEHA